MSPFEDLAAALLARPVRFLLIGVGGANFYALSGGTSFLTQDRDLFLPPDPENLLAAWQTCEDARLPLWSGAEPLDIPRDLILARKVVDLRALTKVDLPGDLTVDLTFVMAGFEFETAWQARREFLVDGVPIPVASIEHIVESKARVGRPKDRLFLATYEDVLRQLLPHGIPKPKTEPGSP